VYLGEVSHCSRHQVWFDWISVEKFSEAVPRKYVRYRLRIVMLSRHIGSVFGKQLVCCFHVRFTPPEKLNNAFQLNDL